MQGGWRAAARSCHGAAPAGSLRPRRGHGLESPRMPPAPGRRKDDRVARGNAGRACDMSTTTAHS